MTSSPSRQGIFLSGARLSVLLISPQRWDSLKVSKHYYAMELAALGHRVWFVEPPDLAGQPGAITSRETDVPGIARITYTPSFPYWLKFRVRWLFDRLMARQAASLVRALEKPPDIVWDFDNAYQFADLRTFAAPFTIFHPVDDLMVGRDGDKRCDLLLSISQVFLDRIGTGRGHVIKHSISRDHERQARLVSTTPARERQTSQRPQVGYVGNLEHGGVDWATLTRMVEAIPEADFHFIGPHNRIGNRTGPSVVPLEALARHSNCRLPGPMPPTAILQMADKIDIWLVCYNAHKSRDGGINSHKILEYLATGNAILSNRLAEYEGSDLVEMPPTADNAPMPHQLRDMLGRLAEIDAPEARRKRAEYALGLSYSASLQRIDALAAVARCRTKA